MSDRVTTTSQETEQPAEAAETVLAPVVSLLPETASDSTVRFVRAMIFSGELRPGDRLPPERDLGARLGISRMTLRLALKALESTGYIVTTRGSRGGSRVADAASLFECWKQWMHQHADELEDVFEFRTTIETRLAALAAERRTDADLQAMERATLHERDRRDWSSLFHTDMDIHRAIARASHSPRLEQAMLQVRSELFAPVNLAQLEEEELQVHRSHTRIIEAIRSQDAGEAANQMRIHLDLIRGLTYKALVMAGITPPPSFTESGKRRT